MIELTSVGRIYCLCFGERKDNSTFDAINKLGHLS